MCRAPPAHRKPSRFSLEGGNMSAKHTPGPLEVMTDPLPIAVIESSSGYNRTVCEGFGDGPESEADAEHIVSCWNACLGINPAAVPGLLVALEGMKRVFGKRGFTELAAIPGALDAVDAATRTIAWAKAVPQ